MKLEKLTVIIIIIVGFLVSAAPLSAVPGGMETCLPELKDWPQKDKTNVYDPDNLYEYINGAAEIFLSYDFEKLVSATFESKKNKEHSFTVDIYRHNNSRNGFGIYSQEKPQSGDFLSIGAQGYYEKGVLNFLKGQYYVKISGYSLGDNDKVILIDAAKQVAKKLEGEDRFPTIVEAFPSENKVTGTSRYVAKNFLGHSFLHSAFITNYKEKDQELELFIIEGENEAELQKMMDGYLAFIEKKGITAETPDKFSLRFQDPYYRSYGKMNMKRKGTFLWGLFSKSDDLGQAYLKRVEENLLKAKLIKK